MKLQLAKTTGICLLILGALIIYSCSGEQGQSRDYLLWDVYRLRGNVKEMKMDSYQGIKDGDNWTQGDKVKGFVTRFAINGNVTDYETFGPKNKKISKSTLFYMGDKLEKEVFLDRNNAELKEWVVKEYDEEGRIKTIHEHNKYGNHYNTISFEYEPASMTKVMTLVVDGSEKKEKYIYNKNDEIERIEYIAFGDLKAWSEFQYFNYDDAGNWTKRLEIFTSKYIGAEQRYIRLQTREISYY